MASTVTRRPLPALIALLALLLLTALVWWRVMHRSDGKSVAKPCPTQTAAQTLPAPARITVTVLNASKRNGIGATTRTALVGDGFNVPRPAANDAPRTKVPGVAEIRYGPAGAKGATLLRYYFPGARMVPTASKTATVVVSLGNKYVRIAEASTVQAALKKANIVVETATSTSTGPSPSASCTNP
ncbi:MAG: LytR C-terminal domain-containing protein [Jatrophihabitans sp.]